MDYLFSLAFEPAAWAALITLTVMEIILGIDNLIFISILSNKLPENQRSKARRIGIAAALILRLSLLGAIAIIVKLTTPVFDILNNSFSWRDIVLIAGGLFLVWKATTEIHQNVDPDPRPKLLNSRLKSATMISIVMQILILDAVFSVDSIITAVGMTEHVPLMVIAILIAVSVMLFAADPLANFIHANPTIVMLALGFLLLIGTTLIAEGFGAHVSKGYIYAAMAFSAFIEGLNILSRNAYKKRLQAET